MAKVADRVALEGEVTRLRERLPAYPMSYVYFLLAVGAVDAADRTILSTVFEDVKRAFDVSDSTLGILAGAYSVVATLSVIPFGFLADRWYRVRLIALGFVPWSIAMFLTGAATSFAMMFAARIFLGAIEATNGPSTPSLLGDYYPVARRSRVFGLVGLGSLAGTLMGFGLAGVIATAFGWRASFFVWGVAGLVCGALVLRVLPEPERGIPDALHRAEERLAELDAPEPATAVDASGETQATSAPRVPRAETDHDYRTIGLGASLRVLVPIRTMWILYVASAVSEFMLSGVSTWAPTFFRRYHGLSAAGAGATTALLALGAVGGILMGGRITDRQYGKGNHNARIYYPAVAAILTTLFFFPAFALDSFVAAAPLFFVTGFLITFPMAPLQAVGLDVVVPRLRGRAAAIRSILRVGMTASAPIAFGWLSDAYGLRQAFLIVAPFAALNGLILLLARATYAHDAHFTQAEALRQHRLEEAERAASGLGPL